VTIAFFALAGLELLGALDRTGREGWIDWLWSVQAGACPPYQF
jgi:prenyltransferase beta subunit